MNTNKGRWRRWTKDEDEYVRRMHCKLPSAEVARALGRGVVAVRMRARLLGLATRRHVWTQKQDNILRNRYATTPITSLATLIGVTKHSVRYRVRVLNLKKTPPWKSEEDKYLRRWYARKSKRAIAEHLKRKQDSVYRRAKALGVSPPGAPVWTAEENRFLRNNYRIKGAAYVVTSLGRSAAAVRLHAGKIGVAEKRKRRQGL